MKSKKESIIKSIVWRILSVVTLAVITYIFTKNLITVTLVTVVSNIIFLILFYINERIWLKIPNPKNKLKRSISKMLTYITIMGMPTMFLITFIFTGSIIIMTEVTITYVITKHIMYVIFELAWIGI